MNSGQLTWARTGASNSKNHLAVNEPYQVDALCGVSIAHGGTTEIRPLLATTWCEKCIRVARRMGVEAYDVGIENDLA